MGEATTAATATICARCGTANGAGAKFCQECGAALGRPVLAADDPDAAPDRTEAPTAAFASVVPPSTASEARVVETRVVEPRRVEPRRPTAPGEPPEEPGWLLGAPLGNVLGRALIALLVGLVLLGLNRFDPSGTAGILAQWAWYVAALLVLVALGRIVFGRG